MYNNSKIFLPVGFDQRVQITKNEAVELQLKRRKRLRAVGSQTAQEQSNKLASWLTKANPATDVVTIRRYANRKSYMTNARCYINLPDIERLIQLGFKVTISCKDNPLLDLTRDTMLAVMLRMESVTTEEIIERIKKG